MYAILSNFGTTTFSKDLLTKVVINRIKGLIDNFNTHEGIGFSWLCLFDDVVTIAFISSCVTRANESRK